MHVGLNDLNKTRMGLQQLSATTLQEDQRQTRPTGGPSSLHDPMIVMEPGAKGFPRAVQLANQGLLLRIIDFRSARSDEEIELAATEMLEDRLKRGHEVLYV